MSRLRPRRQATEDGGQRGQGLVEFSLIFPMIFVLFLAIVEIALAFNAVIAVNRASQTGGYTASIMGNTPGTDCLILSQIEDDMYAPNNPAKIISVVIERAPPVGQVPYAEQKYDRSASGMDCTLPNETEPIHVPYVLTSAGLPAYPEAERCTVLKGCPDLGRTSVDNVGVRVRYHHDWATPLNAVFDYFGGGNQGWSFTQRNIFRMEPTL